MDGAKKKVLYVEWFKLNARKMEWRAGSAGLSTVGQIKGLCPTLAV